MAALVRPKVAHPFALARWLRARYDAAQTHSENQKHWAAADGLSADASASAEVRRLLRNRCRYEVANNSYAKGIGHTIANDTIGTGPTLQMLLPRMDAKAIETTWWEWAQEIRLAEKLRQMRFARYDSGEVFAIFINNPGLRHPVKLDIQLVEAEQIADPSFESLSDPNWVDGIRYDTYGNPLSYRKLRHHPGSHAWMTEATEYDDIDARYVWHYYRPDRPGQHRGIPDITSAVQLFAELRRYTAAVIAAAETAADYAAVIHTDAGLEEEDVTGGSGEGNVDDAGNLLTDFDTFPLSKRLGTVLPHGYKLTQMEAEQPTTNHPQFVDAKLKEIARCVCVPFHIAAMDPSAANMSSSYVIGQFYVHERMVDRSELDRFLDRSFAYWVDEAERIPDYLPDLPGTPHEWRWPDMTHHADPQKVANAAATEMSVGLTSPAREYARKGEDFEDQQELASKSFGISVLEYQKLLRDKVFGQKQEQPNEQKTTSEAETEM